MLHIEKKKVINELRAPSFLKHSSQGDFQKNIQNIASV